MFAKRKTRLLHRNARTIADSIFLEYPTQGSISREQFDNMLTTRMEQKYSSVATTIILQLMWALLKYWWSKRQADSTFSTVPLKQEPDYNEY